MSFNAAAILTTICIVLGLSSKFVMAGATVISVLFVVLATPEAAVGYMFYLLPFAYVFKFGPGSTSIFTYIQILVVLKLFLVNQKIKRRFLYAWLVLILWQAVGSRLQILVLVKQMIVPITVYMVLENCRMDTTRLTKCLAIGLLLSSLIGQAKDLIPPLSKYLVEIRAYDVAGLVYRFTGLNDDPNHYGSISILVTIGLICQLFDGKLERKWLIVVGALILLGLTTISKSYFLMLCVVVLMVLLMCLKKKKYTLFIAGIGALLLVVVLVAIGSINLFDSMLQRLTYSSDITTGRTAIWLRYLRELFSEPIHLIFGYGIGAEPLRKVAHNTLIDLLFYYGIVGSVLFLYPLFLIIGRKNKSDIFHISPLVCFLLMLFFLSYLMYYDLAFLLIYVIAYMKGTSAPAEAVPETVDEGLASNT